MIDPKKELNTEELENVNGGGCGKSVDDILPSNHGIHIGMYDAENHIGERVYVINDGTNHDCYYGILKASWEKKIIGNATKRIHRIDVEGTISGYSSYVGTEQLFWGDTNTLYLYN